MNPCLTVLLAAALLGHPAREETPRGPRPETPTSEKPTYRSVASLQYGEHASQSFGINYYPAGPPRPIIIYLHSGGWASGPITRIPPTPEHYEELGFAFAVVGHRTVKEFPHPAQVTDIQAGVRHIKENAAKWNIDPERIVVTGRSSGGHLTQWVGFHPDSPKVAAIIPRSAPATLDPEFIKTFAGSWTLNNYYKMLYGPDVIHDAEAMARIYKEFSPGTYMTADVPPTLYLNNFTPPPGPNAKPNWAAHHHLFGVDAYTRLKKAGGTAHLFVNRKGRDRQGFVAAETAFLRKYILGEKDIEMPPTGIKEIDSQSAAETSDFRIR